MPCCSSQGSSVPFLPRCERLASLREKQARLALGDRGDRWVILALGSSCVVLFLPGVSDAASPHPPLPWEKSTSWIPCTKDSGHTSNIFGKDRSK